MKGSDIAFLLYRAMAALALHTAWVKDELPRIFGDLEAQSGRVYDEMVEHIGDPEVSSQFAGQYAREWIEDQQTIEQVVLNLFAVGHFQLLEQHLASLVMELCAEAGIQPPNNLNRGSVLIPCSDWLQVHCDINLKSLPSWANVSELKDVANTVKHGEGDSSTRLRVSRPESVHCSASLRRRLARGFLAEVSRCGCRPLCQSERPLRVFRER
jgi:hypothetical protein